MQTASIVGNASVAIRSRVVGRKLKMPTVTWHVPVRKLPFSRVAFNRPNRMQETQQRHVGAFINPGVNGFRSLGCYKYVPKIPYPKPVLRFNISS